MSVAYRERERDRFEDSRTSVSSSRRDGGYTTIKRYRIGEDDSRSSVDRRFQVNRPGERVEETRIVRREQEIEEPRRRDPEPRYSETDVVIRREREDEPRRRDPEPRYSETDVVIRREREDEPRRRDPEPRYSETDVVIRREREDEPRRDYDYDRRREERDDTRELVIRRTTTRDEPRVEERDLRVEKYEVDRRDFRERDYELLSPDRDRHPDLQRYSRSTEYFSQPQQPQTIIIKQEPIIIRERVRDDDYDIVRRSDVEDRQLVRREPPREEEYFYERKTKEVEAPHREREEGFYERREREVSPHDSVSQVGRRERSRHHDRDDESDDSMVYVRKETREEDYSRDESPRHRRHIAEGVLAGVGAAELLRHHKNKKGEETSGTLGRIGKDVGAGVLGAVGAEVITRARSRYRSKSRRRDQSRSRSRSRSDSRETRKSRGRKHKKDDRSRSRSESRSRFKTLGGLGLAAAGIAAAAAYAQKKSHDKAEEGRGRSRSRSQARTETVVDGMPDDARNPKHRNTRIAEAGLGGAVVAGLIEGARSRSRAKRGERSRSRLRQGLEVAAAGLGSAALAGIYERNKGKKEAEAAEKEARHQERRAAREQSRSTSRAPVGPYYEPNRALSDPGLIEYGDGPMHGNNYGADYYGRPAQQENYYSDAMVPVTGAAGAAYGAREARDRSRSRSRTRRSTSSSPEPNDRRRRRHRKDRSRSAGGDVAGAGVGAAALTENERKQRKREEKARRRAAENAGRDPYADDYEAAPYAAAAAAAAAAPPAAAPGGYGAEPGYYQQAPGFPPPPGTVPNQYPPQPQYAAPGAQYAPPPNQAEYNPANFPPPPGTVPPPPVPPANYNEAFASGANMDPYAPRTRRADENVSAAPSNGINSFPDQHYVPPSGLDSTRGPPPPSIAVHPPAPTPPPASGSHNSTYVPPAELSQSPPEPPSQPRSESTSRRKSVKFTDGVATNADSLESQDRPPQSSGLEDRRPHRRARNGESSRGYDAGDNTDSTPDEYRWRQQDPAPVPDQTLPTSNDPTVDPSSNRRRHHRRSRSHEPSSSQPQPSVDRNATSSPASDETIDLPERFDKYGRKKVEPGDDLLADRLQEFLSGSGVGRRLFGNFADGLLGGSRGGNGSGNASGSSRRRV